MTCKVSTDACPSIPQPDLRSAILKKTFVAKANISMRTESHHRRTPAWEQLSIKWSSNKTCIAALWARTVSTEACLDQSPKPDIPSCDAWSLQQQNLFSYRKNKLIYAWSVIHQKNEKCHRLELEGVDRPLNDGDFQTHEIHQHFTRQTFVKHRKATPCARDGLDVDRSQESKSQVQDLSRTLAACGSCILQTLLKVVVYSKRSDR